MTDRPTVLWAISPKPVSYEAAHEAMKAYAQAIREEGAPEMIWLLEHPPLYTSGTSAKLEDLRDPNRFPVFDAGRGGESHKNGKVIDTNRPSNSLQSYHCFKCESSTLIRHGPPAAPARGPQPLALRRLLRAPRTAPTESGIECEIPPRLRSKAEASTVILLFVKATRHTCR